MDNPFQVFSNLKNFCATYPRYNYNTLNNYLSKNKIAYENEQVRVERKSIITNVLNDKAEQQYRRIVPVVKNGMLKDLDQDMEDYNYWLSKPIQARAAAVTLIIAQSLEQGQRMDKSMVKKGKLIKR